MRTKNVNDDAQQWGERVACVAYELCVGTAKTEPKCNITITATTATATSARTEEKKNE